MKKISALLLLNSLLFADITIITSKDNSLNSADSNTVSKIYLKKITHVNNKTVTPIDNIDDYDEFYKKVVKKTPQQVHSYWMKEIFTGKKRPPKKIASKDLEANLQEDTTAVSYSQQTQNVKETKVIYEVK